MKQIILRAIRVYQCYFSLDTGLIGKIFPHPVSICRYRPTCSQYMYDAISAYGIITGLWLGLGRVLRCHPWSRGGWDPVR